MPKSLKIHANSRIDIEDFNLAATDYTKESIKALTKGIVLDDKSRTVDGFRIEIADQTTSPGQITVYNGLGFDKSGQQITIEGSPEASLTTTLAGSSQTFYLEVEYTEVDTDVDARAFWDPTVDNADPVPDGAESFLSVSTRVTPSWRIVTPVSTVGFQSSTDFQSNRIPIAILITDSSNRIVELSPSYFQPASTNLETSATAGSFTVKVLDSTLFPIGTTAEIIPGVSGGPSDLGLIVTVVDYENNIVTFSNPLVSNHNPGAILRSTNSVRYVPEEVDPNNPAYLLIPSQQPTDQQHRLWQGDETRGSAILASKYTTGSGRDDLNVKNIKDHVDAIAASLREMKFGHPSASVTSYPPPFDFTSTRHFDRSASIQGAKTNTVSIGDGVNSYGDLNGSDETVFAQALALLPTGGTIFIKKGNYTFTTGITIPVNTHVTFLGESRTNVFISPVNGEFSQLIDYTDAHLTLLNLNVDDLGQSAVRANNGTGRATLEITNCDIGNITARDTMYLHRCSILGNVDINDGDGRCGIHECVMDLATLITANNTTLVVSSCDIVSRNNLLRIHTGSNVAIKDSKITSERTGPVGNAVPILVEDSSTLNVESCILLCTATYTATSAQTVLINATGASSVVLDSCGAVLTLSASAPTSILSTLYLITHSSSSSLSLSNTSVRSTTVSSYLGSLYSNSTTPTIEKPTLSLNNCIISTRVGIFLDGTESSVELSDTNFSCKVATDSSWYGLYSTGSLGDVIINSCTFDGESRTNTSSSPRVSAFINVGGSPASGMIPVISVNNSTFKNFGRDSVAPSAGYFKQIYYSGAPRSININGNFFKDIYVFGSYNYPVIDIFPTDLSGYSVSIDNNSFSNIKGPLAHTSSVDRGVFSGNVVKSCTVGNFMVQSTSTTNFVVSNNNISSCTIGALDEGGSLIDVTNAVITGNNITSITTSTSVSSQIHYIIKSLTSSYVNVSNNAVKSVIGRNIRVIEAEASDLNVHGNTLVDIVGSGGVALTGIHFSVFSSGNASISNNMLELNGLGAGNISGIFKSSTSNKGDVQIIGNCISLGSSPGSPSISGITTTNCSSVSICSNIINTGELTTRGISSTGSDSSVVSGNVLTGASVAPGATPVINTAAISVGANDSVVDSNVVTNWLAERIYSIGSGGSSKVINNTTKDDRGDIGGPVRDFFIQNFNANGTTYITGNSVVPKRLSGFRVQIDTTANTIPVAASVDDWNFWKDANTP